MEQLTGGIKLDLAYIQEEEDKASRSQTNKRERLRFINGRQLPSDYQTFAFDGCHKIYLCANDEAEVMMEGYGYQILPISQLPTAWKNSCSLRFIQDAETFEEWVPQFKGARFKGFGKKPHKTNTPPFGVGLKANTHINRRKHGTQQPGACPPRRRLLLEAGKRYSGRRSPREALGGSE